MTDHRLPLLARRLSRRVPYYGWVMLGGTTLTTMATSPGQSFVVGAFSEAIRADLGISLAAFSAAYMVATFAASLPLTLVGRLGDRHGTRVVMGGTGLLLGLACAFIGGATWLVGDLVAPGSTGARLLTLATLTVAFFLLRFLGQGALGLVSSHALAMWFERRLGLVESIRNLGVPIALAVLPAVLLTLIAGVGWRWAYTLLGVAVWLVVLPVAALVHVSTPDQLGQRIDGAPAPLDHEPAPADAFFTLRQSLRTRAYWIVTASMVLSAAVGTSFVFHTQPMMLDLGLTTRAAAAVVATLGLVSLAATVPSGHLVDRLAPRHLLAATGFLLAGACGCYVLAGHATSGTLLIAHGAFLLLALSQSLLFVLASPLFARFFGRRHHGAVRGSLTTFMVAGTSAGPYVFAQWRAFTGDFEQAYLAAAVVAVVLAVWALRLSRPVAAEMP